MKEIIGKVKLIDNVAKDVYKLVINSSLEMASSGQFISILCGNTTLRRPFSICDFEKKENETLLTVIFKLKGAGTEYLKNLKVSDDINFLAPLGNGFKKQNKKSLLVGAGIGIAPLLFLKKELIKNNIDNYLISGFKTENEIIIGSDENVVGGSVLDNIEEKIVSGNFEIVYSCGPKIVLKKISQICVKLDIPIEIAMEKVMACGIGVCRGCVIKIFKDEKIQNASICKDGPVFDGSEVVWE